MSNVFRVRDLAKEFEVTNKELIARCGDLDIVAKSAMSRLSEEDVATIRASFKKATPAKSTKTKKPSKPRAKKQSEAEEGAEAKPKRTPGQRRSRARSKSKEEVATEAAPAVEAADEPVAEKKPRRRGARRRSEKPADATPEAKAEVADVKAESDEKPARRSRSRRGSKKAEPEVKETVEVTEAAAEEKPKRSRRSRSRKPKTEEAEVVEAKSDDAVEVKPKRARRRGKAADAKAEVAEAKVEADEKPKRSRRGRSKAKKEEVEAAEAPAEEVAETRDADKKPSRKRGARRRGKGSEEPAEAKTEAAEEVVEVESNEPAAPVHGGGLSDFARAFLRNLGKPQRDPVNEAPATPVSFELPPEPGRVVPSSLAKRGRLWLDELFKAMNIDATATSEYDKDAKALSFNVEGPGSQKLLGSTGTSPKSVESIEKILVQFLDVEELAYTVSLDVNGFRRKAIERLEALANELAKVAGDVHTSIAVAGLNDFERRVVHRHLAELGDIRTESFDHGSFRKIRIEKD